MKVSFVIPSFNSAVWLPHAVESCLKQDWDGEIETVIVNDGSTDSTKQYLDWLEKSAFANDKRPIKIIHTKNQGRSKARNEGLANATGDYLFMLDADDYNAPNRVKKTMSLFQKGADFVYGSVEVMDFTGTKIGTLRADVFDKTKAIERMTNEIVHSSVAFTKQIGRDFKYCEDKDISDNGIDDWEQQLRIAFAGVKMDFTPTTIVAYRVLQSAISQWRDQNKVNEAKKKYIEQFKVPA